MATKQFINEETAEQIADALSTVGGLILAIERLAIDFEFDADCNSQAARIEAVAALAEKAGRLNDTCIALSSGNTRRLGYWDDKARSPCNVENNAEREAAHG